MDRRVFLKVSQQAAAALLVSGPAAARAAHLTPVVLGQVSLSFYAVVGGVIHAILERLGHVVEIRQGPHEQMFPLLADASLDLMVGAWLPEGHGVYWEQYGKNAREVTRLYDGARFFWAVPGYVPANEVASLADLAKHDVAVRMDKRIQAIGAGAGITLVSAKAVRAYGLDSAGYSVRPGTAAEWIAAYESAIAGNRWMVFPTWAPQYLNRGEKLRPLADPEGILGGANRAVLVAPSERFGRLPQTTRSVLSRISLDIDSVTEMDWQVNVNKMAPLAAAKAWMDSNPHRVAAWLQIPGISMKASGNT